MVSDDRQCRSEPGRASARLGHRAGRVLDAGRGPRLAASRLPRRPLRPLCSQPRLGCRSTDTRHGPPFEPLHEQQRGERKNGAQQGQVEHGSPGGSECMPPPRLSTSTHWAPRSLPRTSPVASPFGLQTARGRGSILKRCRSGHPLGGPPQGVPSPVTTPVDGRRCRRRPGFSGADPRRTPCPVCDGGDLVGAAGRCSSLFRHIPERLRGV